MAAARCSGLRGSSSKQNAIADTCFLCCFLVRKLNVCHTWHSIVRCCGRGHTGPSYLQVCMYPEIRPEFLSLEFRTKLILLWNDLIPTCVPTESGNAAELHGFRTMMPGRNRNTKRNAHPSFSSPVVLGDSRLLQTLEPD